MINPELEAEIARSADDDTGPYLVYADWLTERGDPRGELIVAAVRGLAEREAQLHALHDPQWLGELYQHPGVAGLWRNGFVHAARVGGRDRGRSLPDLDRVLVYAQLRALPVASLLRVLVFEATQSESWADAVKAIGAHGLPASLRELVFDRGTYWDISTTWLGDLSPIYPHAGELASLHIKLGQMELGEIELPALRDFEVYTGGFTKDNMRSVLAADWPRLERLILRFGDREDYGAECELADVLPLLDGARIPHVTALGIGNAPFVDDLIPHLVRSPVLPRLRTLDLSLGTLSDAGGEQLLAHADAFRHLAALDLRRSFLSEGMCARLRAALPQANLERQEIADADDGEVYRYCAISE